MDAYLRACGIEESGEMVRPGAAELAARKGPVFSMSRWRRATTRLLGSSSFVVSCSSLRGCCRRAPRARAFDAAARGGLRSPSRRYARRTCATAWARNEHQRAQAD